uniref:Putative transglycosylase n=1 Tax=viral metagenome TaxID=1070528 RepID=A0A6M3KXQ1_9ZZZZ
MLYYLTLLFLLISQSGGHVDAYPLSQAGKSVTPNVPPNLMWAIAYVESRHNLDPSLVAHGCASSNCAVGRMQIKPNTAKRYCPRLDIYTYYGNIKCSARILRAHYAATGSWDLAAAWYHSRTPEVHEPYLERVLRRMGRYSYTEIE